VESVDLKTGQTTLILSDPNLTGGAGLPSGRLFFSRSNDASDLDITGRRNRGSSTRGDRERMERLGAPELVKRR
jgi:hypothetical protein